MKLTPRTVAVLKNLSSINPGIIVEPGNILRAFAPTKTILATLTTDQTFEKKFAVYNLSRFLGVLSLFENPELDFHDTHVSVSGNGRSVRYTYADERTIVAPPQKKLSIDSPAVTTSLPQVALSDVMRGLGVLKLPEIAITGDGEKVCLKAIDSKGASKDFYAVDLGATDKTFTAVFGVQNIRLIDADYQVDLAPNFSRFYTEGAEYFVAIEASSKFQE